MLFWIAIGGSIIVIVFMLIAASGLLGEEQKRTTNFNAMLLSIKENSDKRVAKERRKIKWKAVSGRRYVSIKRNR